MKEVYLPKEMRDLRILLVEDMSFYHSIIPQTLTNFGFVGELHSGKNLKETEKIIKDLYRNAKKIDLILTDFHLPDGTGLDLIKKVRANKVLSNIPILMLTTDNNSKGVIESFEAGLDNYLFKPIEDKFFLEKLIFVWKKRNP